MNGHTQASFAELVGVHPSQVSRYLKGQRPEKKTALAIAEATGGAVIDIDYLEGFESVNLDTRES